MLPIVRPSIRTLSVHIEWCTNFANERGVRPEDVAVFLEVAQLLLERLPDGLLAKFSCEDGRGVFAPKQAERVSIEPIPMARNKGGGSANTGGWIKWIVSGCEARIRAE
jgi:hypothetical protein